MAHASRYHRPLMSGVKIITNRRIGDGTIGISAGGTLTGLARRNSDNEKVLVTCLHVMTGSVFLRTVGNEEMYQQTMHADHKVGTVEPPTQNNPSSAPIGTDSVNPIMDVAYSKLDMDVAAQHILHDYPEHTGRQIILGTVPPRPNMRLQMIGAFGGEGRVWVRRINQTERVGPNEHRWSGVVVLDTSERPGVPGDSGAPLLEEIDANRYKMCCIYFGFNREGEDLALPASVAERALDITFGNRPPTADAGADKIANRGQEGELVGSGTDPDGDTLTYRWEQLGLDEPGVVPVVPVTINNADQADASFVAPAQIGALSFRLTVTDSHGASHSDTVTVTVRNREPIALAGRDKLITAGHRVTLEGSVSDLDAADRTSVTHTWTQDDNNPATVTLARVEGRPAQRTFSPSTTGDYTFTLTATDPYGLTASDEVQVRVLESSQSLIPASVTATAAGSSVDISWNSV